MYKYMYIKAVAEGFFRVSNHRELIEEYSEKGWRFITAIATQFSSHGVIKEYDLVFEKKVDEDV